MCPGKPLIRPEVHIGRALSWASESGTAKVTRPRGARGVGRARAGDRRSSSRPPADGRNVEAQISGQIGRSPPAALVARGVGPTIGRWTNGCRSHRAGDRPPRSRAARTSRDRPGRVVVHQPRARSPRGRCRRGTPRDAGSSSSRSAGRRGSIGSSSWQLDRQSRGVRSSGARVERDGSRSLSSAGTQSRRHRSSRRDRAPARWPSSSRPPWGDGARPVGRRRSGSCRTPAAIGYSSHATRRCSGPASPGSSSAWVAALVEAGRSAGGRAGVVRRPPRPVVCLGARGSAGALSWRRATRRAA